MNRNTPIRKDWFILGLAAGMASSGVKSAINWLLGKSGLPTAPYGLMAGNMVLGKREPSWLPGLKPVRTRGEIWIGRISDVIFGGAFGVASAYLMSKSPPGNEIFKGALGGSILWALTFMVPNQMRVSKLKPAEMGTLLLTDIIFGMVHGAIIGRYGSSLVRESHPVPVEPVSERSFNKGRLAQRRQPSFS